MALSDRMTGQCGLVTRRMPNRWRMKKEMEEKKNILTYAGLRALEDELQDLKVNYLGSVNPRLHTDEILLSLSICAVTNPLAKLALEQLKKLRGCEAHATVILSSVDERTLHKLGINLTCDPKHESQNLYHN